MYRYDEETGDMWDDGMPQAPVFPGSSCSNGLHSGSSRFGRMLPAVLRCLAIGAICLVGWALGYAAGEYFPSRNVVNRIEGWWKATMQQVGFGDAGRENAQNEDAKGDSPANGVGEKVIVRCCVCKAQLDITHLMHLHSFVCVCPHCNSSLKFTTGNSAR